MKIFKLNSVSNVYISFYSVADLVSDILLFKQYLDQQNNIFAALTLTFVYLPSLTVICALFGPKRAANFAVIGGITIAIPTLFLQYFTFIDFIGDFGRSDFPIPLIILISLFLIACNWFVLGLVLSVSIRGNKCSCSEFIRVILVSIISILLLPILPIIFLQIKLLAVFKPNDKFIQAQARLGSRGEALFEATPQFILLLYNVLTSLQPTPVQIFSMVTSSLTLSLPNLELYLTSRSKEFGFKNILKNFSVFFSFSLFKALSVSLIFLHFKFYSFSIILPEIVSVIIWLLILKCCFNIILEGVRGCECNCCEGGCSFLF